MTQQVKMTFAGLVLISLLAFSWLFGSGTVHLPNGADPVPPTLHLLHPNGADPLPPTLHLFHPNGADPLPPTL